LYYFKERLYKLNDIESPQDIGAFDKINLVSEGLEQFIHQHGLFLQVEIDALVVKVVIGHLDDQLQISFMVEGRG
jgi:hypothetical protein